MSKAALSLAALLCLTLTVGATAEENRSSAIMPLDQIHEGMRGTAYTVFQGTKPEPMEVEVLGVLHNVNGPRGDIILVRLHGTKPEYTGVVAGMSGSPVYFDGKLAGAIAFRIGEFSKEPIAGVTPIEKMLEIDALDQRPAPGPAPANPTEPSGATRTASPGENATLPLQSYSNYLKPIETPLVFNGFSEETLRRYAPQFASAGVIPVMGIGSASDRKQPEPIEPGSAVSAVLVRGDMDIAATCTVTYIDPQRLLACGHPLMQFGRVDLPMTKANVLATLPSPLNAFKIVNTTESVGSFVQDRHSGILGQMGREPKMIPVTVTVRGGQATKEFHYEILNNARLSPVAMMATVFNALHGTNEYGDNITYRMNGALSVKGYPEVALKNMFAPMDSGQPAAALAAATIGDRFGRIYDNPYDVPEIQGVKLDFDLVRERRSARLEASRTDMTEARPGDQIMVETVLRPYRGERLVRQIPIRIPTSASKGMLRILVSDGDTLDRMRRGMPLANRKLGLASTIALLNKEHANNRVYVSLFESDPEAMVADKVMPTLPLSVMNVMDNMRGTQEMVVLNESSVNEASTEPLDYVVAGAQMLMVTVK
ncbi:MAG: SpoIVB peptidase S55 [Acidobacteriales bacterium]|nr:SpoIVB peptidase S55 [Candidatus Koribacter versatilis]MBI3647111.1 SpoIVB peptidase S55 [Terriglobales bacterium]